MTTFIIEFTHIQLKFNYNWRYKWFNCEDQELLGSKREEANILA